MRLSTAVGIFAIVLAVLPETGQAQAAPERATFVLLRGADTVARETFLVRGDSLWGSLRITGAPRQDYIAVLRPDRTIVSLSLRVFAAADSTGAVPLQQVWMAVYPDSVDAGSAGRFVIAHGAVPFVGASYAGVELLTRRARASGGTLDAPLFAVAGAIPLTATLAAIGRDSMSLTIAGSENRLRVDADGRVRGGTLPAARILIVRVDSASDSSLGFGPVPLPAGIVESDITVPGPVPLPGTLTRPAGKGPFPAIVLIHGSGQNDRDETIGPDKPFRDLAWGLAQRGIAVLRYDKRTHVNSRWFAGRATTVFDETIQDARSALRLLRQQPGIDRKRTFLLGHSLGGMLAPRIVEGDDQVAGIVVMAGATLMKFIDQSARQYAWFDSLGGAPLLRLDAERQAFARDSAAIRALTAADSSDTHLLYGASASYWLDLDAYDPALSMRHIHLPVLVLQGMRDYNVPPDQLDAWLAAVGPRPDITVKRYPTLNHSFVAGNGPPSPADYAVGKHVDAQVILDLASWIQHH